MQVQSAVEASELLICWLQLVWGNRPSCGGGGGLEGMEYLPVERGIWEIFNLTVMCSILASHVN